MKSRSFVGQAACLHASKGTPADLNFTHVTWSEACPRIVLEKTKAKKRTKGQDSGHEHGVISLTSIDSGHR